MSGRKRIMVGEIAQGKARGRALVDALSRLNEGEKNSTYQRSNIK